MILKIFFLLPEAFVRHILLNFFVVIEMRKIHVTLNLFLLDSQNLAPVSHRTDKLSEMVLLLGEQCAICHRQSNRMGKDFHFRVRLTVLKSQLNYILWV